jgi:hypothetical protein
MVHCVSKDLAENRVPSGVQMIPAVVAVEPLFPMRFFQKISSSGAIWHAGFHRALVGAWAVTLWIAPTAFPKINP